MTQKKQSTVPSHQAHKAEKKSDGQVSDNQSQSSKKKNKKRKNKNKRNENPVNLQLQQSWIDPLTGKTMYMDGSGGFGQAMPGYVGADETAVHLQ